MSVHEDDDAFKVPEGEGGEDNFEGNEEQLDAQMEQSSVVSDLTDEQEEFERQERERVEQERIYNENVDRETQQKLKRLMLNPTRRKLLFLMKNNEVNGCLSKFWDILVKDSCAHVHITDLSDCFYLIFKLLFIGFSAEKVRGFADELLGSKKMRESAYYTQEEFFEALLQVVNIFIEDLDVQSATTFLEFLFNRVAIRVIVNTAGVKVTIKRNIHVKFYNTQALNQVFKVEFKHDKQPEDVIYCLEKYEDIRMKVSDPKKSMIIKFMDYDEIVPLGSVVNTIVTSIKNEKDLPKENKVTGQQELSGFISRNETMFFVGFVIEDTDGRVIRLSTSLFSPYFFEELLSKENQRIFVNQRSIYQDDLSIDRVHEMTKRWNKQVEIPKPTDHEIWDKPIEDIYQVLISNKYRLNSKSDDDDQYRDLDFKTSDTFPAIKSESFANFKTREPALPKDNKNPFSQDLIEYAHERPYHILVHGKPKIGKTKFCHSLAKKLDLELIDVDIFVSDFMKRVQEGEENVQNDDEGNPIEFLKPYERTMISDLRKGERIKHGDLLCLINDEISKLRIEQKGCVMEIPCFDNPTKQMNFAKLIQEGSILVNNLTPSFNVIVELYVEDERLFHRTRQIRENSNTLNFITVSDGELLNPPEKVINEDDDDADQQDDIDPDDPSIIKQENLYNRINESDVMVRRGLENYKEHVRPVIEDMEKHIHHLNKIFLDYDSLTIVQSVDTVYGQLLPRSRYNRPVASIIEDVGEEDYASLTRANIKTEEGEFMRRWSPFWKHDPVALFNKKVQRGLSQFSCDYAGRIFCFTSEENMAEFMRDPKKFLMFPPQIPPQQYNISLVGMKNTGKRLFAEKLAERYGLEIVDLASIIEKKFIEQNALETHVPNNPEAGNLGFSKPEFAEFRKGTPIDVKLALPFLLQSKEIPLWKRPPPPKDPDQIDDEERLKKEEEERLKLEAAKKKKDKKKEEKKEEEKPQVVVVEDILLADIVPKPDEKGVLPEPKGWIFLDFPISENQILSMKEMNIILDRVVILKEPDTNETGDAEEPGRVVGSRPGFYDRTTLLDEQQYIEAASTAIRTGIEEDKITEVFSSDIDITYLKIRQFVDPFCPRIDDDSTALPTDNEDTSDKVLFGEYGPYCPVTVTDDRWLVLGNLETEVQVRGKRYRFYNEEAKKKFEEGLERYLHSPEVGSPIPPEPRIFITGCTGAGLKTHSTRLHTKLKIPIVSFRNEFKKVMEYRKNTRREHRRLIKGFNEVADENGVPIIPEEDKEQEPDPEVENDPDDFDNTKNEHEICNILFSKVGAAIVNCKLEPEKVPPVIFPPEEEPEDEVDPDDQDQDRPPPPVPKKQNEEVIEEEVLKQPFVELLTETKKLPDIMIILLVGENEMISRIFNKKRIQDEYDNRMMYIEGRKEKARQRKVRELEKERKARKDEGGEGADEIDLSVPIELDADTLEGIYQSANIPEDPDYNKMVEDEKERLLTILREERAKLEELAESLIALNVNVLMFEANKNIEKVFMKIGEEVRKVVEDREALFARSHVVPIVETETLTTGKVLEWTLKSFTIKESRYAGCNPIQPERINHSSQFPLIYNDRVFYLSTKEERDLVSRNPIKYLCKTGHAPPKDVFLKPKIVLLGKYKSGKSVLAKRVSELLGLVHVTLDDVQELFVKNKFYGKGKDLFEVLSTGKVPSDELLVEILALRLKFSDCAQHGYLIEGFPKTKMQAILMYKNKITPDIVVNQLLEDYQVKARAFDPLSKETLDNFEFDEEILNLRLVSQREELKAAENLYTYNFGNIRQLVRESTDSKVAELSLILEEFIKGRQEAAVGINRDAPFEASKLSIKSSTIMASLCPGLTFSAVSLKKYGSFEQMLLRSDKLVYYRNNFYLLKDQEQIDAFVENPDHFKSAKVLLEQVAAIASPSEIYQITPELRQYCPVELFSKKLVKGKKHLSLMAFGKLYCFSSLKAMRTFFKNPSVFYHIKLPEKIKVQAISDLKDPSKSISERGDLQTYIQNEISRLIVKALNQASKFRLKYPTISIHSTALKLVALCLKSLNPNQSEDSREKYKQKMRAFIADCLLADQVLTEAKSRGTI